MMPIQPKNIVTHVFVSALRAFRSLLVLILVTINIWQQYKSDVDTFFGAVRVFNMTLRSFPYDHAQGILGRQAPEESALHRMSRGIRC